MICVKVIDVEYDQFRSTVTVKIRYGDGRALIAP
jgi:ribosomal protein L2